MTVPVRSPLDEVDGSTMVFFLPKEVAEAGAPSPQEDGVVLFEYPAGLWASVTFGGRATERKVADKKLALEQWLSKQKVERVGEWYLDRFDSPWTPWFVRKNEVLVRVER